VARGLVDRLLDQRAAHVLLVELADRLGWGDDWDALETGLIGRLEVVPMQRVSESQACTNLDIMSIVIRPQRSATSSAFWHILPSTAR
jgi:hypothetical protein